MICGNPCGLLKKRIRLLVIAVDAAAIAAGAWSGRRLQKLAAANKLQPTVPPCSFKSDSLVIFSGVTFSGTRSFVHAAFGSLTGPRPPTALVIDPTEDAALVCGPGVHKGPLHKQPSSGQRLAFTLHEPAGRDSQHERTSYEVNSRQRSCFMSHVQQGCIRCLQTASMSAASCEVHSQPNQEPNT